MNAYKDAVNLWPDSELRSLQKIHALKKQWCHILVNLKGKPYSLVCFSGLYDFLAHSVNAFFALHHTTKTYRSSKAKVFYVTQECLCLDCKQGHTIGICMADAVSILQVALCDLLFCADYVSSEDRERGKKEINRLLRELCQLQDWMAKK